MKQFLLLLLLTLSVNSFAQKSRPYLGWSQEKIRKYLADDKNVKYEKTWQSADQAITCISYHKSDDPMTSVLFYFNESTGMCFRHSVFMPLDKLPETVKEFNTLYKREDTGYWRNNSGDTNIKLEYKIGDYSFRVNYTNYIDDL